MGRRDRQFDWRFRLIVVTRLIISLYHQCWRGSAALVINVIFRTYNTEAMVLFG